MISIIGFDIFCTLFYFKKRISFYFKKNNFSLNRNVPKSKRPVNPVGGGGGGYSDIFIHMLARVIFFGSKF